MVCSIINDGTTVGGTIGRDTVKDVKTGRLTRVGNHARHIVNDGRLDDRDEFPMKG